MNTNGSAVVKNIFGTLRKFVVYRYRIDTFSQRLYRLDGFLNEEISQMFFIFLGSLLCYSTIDLFNSVPIENIKIVRCFAMGTILIYYFRTIVVSSVFLCGAIVASLDKTSANKTIAGV